jgi:hypothetical protein
MILRWIGGLLAANLPRRYWPALDDYVTASGMAAVAGIATLLVGLVTGVFGFILFTEDLVSQNNAALANNVDPMAITRYMMWAMNGLVLFQFLFLTPQGWIAMYCTVTGLARALGPTLDDPHGDFLLTLVDAGARTAWAATVRRGEIDNRKLLEGPEVRDRIHRGAHLGLPKADLVVVASRLKDGWEPGAVVVSERGAYRLTDMEDRTIDGRLRRLYSLVLHEDLEVFRKIVHYEFAQLPGDPEGSHYDRKKQM